MGICCHETGRTLFSPSVHVPIVVLISMPITWNRSYNSHWLHRLAHIAKCWQRTYRRVRNYFTTIKISLMNYTKQLILRLCAKEPGWDLWNKIVIEANKKWISNTGLLIFSIFYETLKLIFRFSSDTYSRIEYFQICLFQCFKIRLTMQSSV
jgi:hypothetical protein